jgi:hypothetical protein
MKTLLMRFATEGRSFISSKVPPLLLFLRLILRCLYIRERAAMVKQLKLLEFRKRHLACKLNKSNTHDNVSDDIIRDLQNLHKDICLPPTVLHPWCFHWASSFFFQPRDAHVFQNCFYRRPRQHQMEARKRWTLLRSIIEQYSLL